jgi:transposase-like protein
MAKDVIKEIRRATRRKFSAEEKIRIVLEGLRGEVSPTLGALRHPRSFELPGRLLDGRYYGFIKAPTTTDSKPLTVEKRNLEVGAEPYNHTQRPFVF